MRNRTYGGVRGRKTKVGRKLLRFPPTRLWSLVGLLISPSVPHYGGSLPSGLLLSPDCSGELLQPHGFYCFEMFSRMSVSAWMFFIL